VDAPTLKDAIALSVRLKNIFIATAGPGGTPHIAVAGPLAMAGEFVGVSAWYCPQTLANIEKFPQISIAIWDKPADVGFQIIGKCEKIEDVAVMDGYFPKIEGSAVMPQVEKRLLVRVEKVFYFTQALHTDK
jgi:hypothetical protein